MDDTLKKNPHGVLVGDRVTIADISAWGWVAIASTYPFDSHETKIKEKY